MLPCHFFTSSPWAAIHLLFATIDEFLFSSIYVNGLIHFCVCVDFLHSEWIFWDSSTSLRLLIISSVLSNVPWCECPVTYPFPCWWTFDLFPVWEETKLPLTSINWTAVTWSRHSSEKKGPCVSSSWFPPKWDEDLVGCYHFVSSSELSFAWCTWLPRYVELCMGRCGMVGTCVASTTPEIRFERAFETI